MNTKLTLVSAIAGGALLICGPATAQLDLLSGWSGSASIGALATTGNSESTNLVGSANITKEFGPWAHTAFGNTFSAENNDIETASRFELGYKLERFFTDTFYAFGRGRFDSDDFANIDSRYSIVAGAGNTFLDDGQQTLSAELGVGFMRADYIAPFDQFELAVEEETLVEGQISPLSTPAAPGDREEDDGAVLYGAVNYSNNFRENLTFNSNFNFETSSSNTLTVWDNSLNIALSESIALSLGFLIRNNADIIGSLGDNTDTATRISIVYGI